MEHGRDTDPLPRAGGFLFIPPLHPPASVGGWGWWYKPPKSNRGGAMTKCIICNERPGLNGDGLCNNCQQKVDSLGKARQPDKPFRFVTYRGHVVGMFPSGKGTFAPRLLGRNPDHLPKGKTLNLDHYIEGFSRETIKRLKATVLSLAGA